MINTIIQVILIFQEIDIKLYLHFHYFESIIKY